MRTLPVSIPAILLSLLSILPLGCSSTSVVATHRTTITERERVESAQIRTSPGAWPLPHLSDTLAKGTFQLGGSLAIPTSKTSGLESGNKQVNLPASLAGTLDATIWASPWLGWTLSARATPEGLADARIGILAATRPSPVRLAARLGGGILAMSGTTTLVRESSIDDGSWEEVSRRNSSVPRIHPYLAAGISAQPGGRMGPWLDFQAQTPVAWARWNKASTSTTTIYEVTKEDCSKGSGGWIFGPCPMETYDSVVVTNSVSSTDPGEATVGIASIAAGWVARTGRFQWSLGVRHHAGIRRTALELRASILARSPRKAP